MKFKTSEKIFLSICAVSIIIFGLVYFISTYSPGPSELQEELSSVSQELELQKAAADLMRYDIEAQKGFLIACTKHGIRFTTPGDNYYHRFEYYFTCEKNGLAESDSFIVNDEESFKSHGFSPCPECEYYAMENPIEE